MLLASKAAWAGIVFNIADDGDLGTTPDSARFGGQRQQRSAWSTTCRSCCRFSLFPGTCGENYAPPT